MLILSLEHDPNVGGLEMAKHEMAPIDSNHFNRKVSVHQDFQGLKIDNHFFCDQNLHIVFDAVSPISPTGINEIKNVSIIIIQLRLLIFDISPLNIQLLKAEIILATRPGSQADRDISHLFAKLFTHM
jgi:hypothetical protein